jgi:hypothetical protein
MEIRFLSTYHPSDMHGALVGASSCQSEPTPPFVPHARWMFCKLETHFCCILVHGD